MNNNKYNIAILIIIIIISVMSCIIGETKRLEIKAENENKKIIKLYDYEHYIMNSLCTNNHLPRNITIKVLNDKYLVSGSEFEIYNEKLERIGNQITNHWGRVSFSGMEDRYILHKTNICKRRI